MDKVTLTIVDVSLCPNIKELGENLTPVAELPYLLNVDEFILMEELNNRQSPIRRAYMEGVAATAGKLRSQMLEAAQAGSPSAIEQAVQSLRFCTIG